MADLVHLQGEVSLFIFVENLDEFSPLQDLLVAV